jgi:hypothetical protein
MSPWLGLCSSAGPAGGASGWASPVRTARKIPPLWTALRRLPRSPAWQIPVGACADATAGSCRASRRLSRPSAASPLQICSIFGQALLTFNTTSTQTTSMRLFLRIVRRRVSLLCYPCALVTCATNCIALACAASAWFGSGALRILHGTCSACVVFGATDRRHGLIPQAAGGSGAPAGRQPNGARRRQQPRRGRRQRSRWAARGSAAATVEAPACPQLCGPFQGRAQQRGDATQTMPGYLPREPVRPERSTKMLFWHRPGSSKSRALGIPPRGCGFVSHLLSFFFLFWHHVRTGAAAVCLHVRRVVRAVAVTVGAHFGALLFVVRACRCCRCGALLFVVRACRCCRCGALLFVVRACRCCRCGALLFVCTIMYYYDVLSSFCFFLSFFLCRPCVQVLQMFASPLALARSAAAWKVQSWGPWRLHQSAPVRPWKGVCAHACD